MSVEGVVMSQRTRKAAVVASMVVATMGGVGVSASASAAQPTHAGPAEPSRYGFDGSTRFLCDGRVIRPTSGEFVSRVRALPDGRVLGTTVVHGGAGVDDADNAYTIRLSGKLSGPEDDGSVLLRLVLIGPDDVYRVSLLFADAAPPVVTGDCTVVG